MSLLKMAREYAANPPTPRFDPVQRWYHRLAAHEDAEAWLLSWLPGQGTDLHDHGGSAGAFVVVSGELTEEVATPHGQLMIRTHTGAQEFGPDHVHRIVNNGPHPAVSVHVYGPALKTMRRYRMENERLVVATVESAGVNW